MDPDTVVGRSRDGDGGLRRGASLSPTYVSAGNVGRRGGNGPWPVPISASGSRADTPSVLLRGAQCRAANWLPYEPLAARLCHRRLFKEQK